MGYDESGAAGQALASAIATLACPSPALEAGSRLTCPQDRQDQPV